MKSEDIRTRCVELGEAGETEAWNYEKMRLLQIANDMRMISGKYASQAYCLRNVLLNKQLTAKQHENQFRHFQHPNS